MDFFIVEIKARTGRLEALRDELEARSARLVGLDRQEDTYFRVPDGRLKLRRGNIENSLIFYRRPNQQGPKVSDGKLVRLDPNPALREVLAAALGVLVTVRKERTIFFLDNVKIHLDQVEGLGSFIELEAIDRDGTRGKEALRGQVDELMEAFQIGKEDLIDRSYSDLLLEKSA